MTASAGSTGRHARHLATIIRIVTSNTAAPEAPTPPPTTAAGHHLAGGRVGSRSSAAVAHRAADAPFACGPVEARQTVDEVLDRRIPDALVIGQQAIAGVGLAAASARGLSVPDDLLLACGVDGPDLPTLHSPVTALDLRPEICGRLAAEVLLGTRDGSTLRVRPRLVIRDSSVRTAATNAPFRAVGAP